MAGWVDTLYNRPVSEEVEYFVDNIKTSAPGVDYADGEYLRRELQGD